MPSTILLKITLSNHTLTWQKQNKKKNVFLRNYIYVNLYLWIVEKKINFTNFFTLILRFCVDVNIELSFQKKKHRTCTKSARTEIENPVVYQILFLRPWLRSINMRSQILRKQWPAVSCDKESYYPYGGIWLKSSNRTKTGTKLYVS